jgi:hypothetical protein
MRPEPLHRTCLHLRHALTYYFVTISIRYLPEVVLVRAEVS